MFKINNKSRIKTPLLAKRFLPNRSPGKTEGGYSLVRDKLLRPGVILFILVVVYFIFLIRSDYVSFLGLQNERKILTKALEYEHTRFSALHREIKDLDGEMVIEKIARVQLGLVAAGERAYKIVYDNGEGE